MTGLAGRTSIDIRRGIETRLRGSEVTQQAGVVLSDVFLTAFRSDNILGGDILASVNRPESGSVNRPFPDLVFFFVTFLTDFWSLKIQIKALRIR